MKGMHGRTVDVTLAGASLGVGLLMFATGQYQARHDVAWLVPPLVLCCAAVLLRRAAPVTSVLLGTLAVTADVLLGPSLATPLVYTQVLYDACVHGRQSLVRTLLIGSVAGSVVTAVLGLVLYRDVQALGLAILLAVVTVVPVLTGIHVRHHRDQAHLARQLARLAELDRANAVAGERARMARELHDVIANHLSAVAIHATAALSTDLGAAGTRDALRVIRENSVLGLTEMRQLVGFLRDPAAGDDPTAGLADLDDLAGRARRSGLAVEVSVRGAATDLPTTVDLAAYRIVQESLTNALKHGDGGRVTVEVVHQSSTVDISIASGGVGTGTATDALAGAGAGVVGMRERAELLGGSLSAGPTDRGWLVTARLPRSVLVP